jgi:hypothetical protein
MRSSWLPWLCACASSAGLLACASSPAPPKPAPAVVKPARTRPAPPPPKKPSAYEKRWQSACEAHGALGDCPAPFDRPGLFFDAKQSADHPPPSLCGAVEQASDAAASAALQAKSKALRACFRDADHGAWVEVELGGVGEPAASPGLSPRVPACVAKLVKRALPRAPEAPARRVVLLNGGSTAEGEATLSKESVHALIAAHADEVGACYDGALEVWPGLRGRVAPMVVVWFDGSVALVRTQESTLGNPALECCINTAVRGWRFDPPAGGSIAIVTLPLVLGEQP